MCQVKRPSPYPSTNMNKKKVVITGTAGFIGSHLVEHILKNTDWDIVGIDRLDTSSNINRLTDMECWEKEKNRVKIFHWDLKAELNSSLTSFIGDFDYFVHMAAGSHVDRSITNPMEFINDNVLGAANVFEYFRKHCEGLRAKGISELPKMLYFSTDEVYGPCPEGMLFKEWDRFNPNNPYAASKAAAECIALSYANSYTLPIMITNCMNVFGERQHPEKFVPMLVKKILRGEKVTIHANKDKTKAGTRFYLHTRNICAAVLFLLVNGKTVDRHCQEGRYNIVGSQEVSNLEMAQLIAGILGKPLDYEMVDFHSSRPGHDPRYGLDGSLLKSLGFEYPVGFEDSLRRTVEWTVANQKWLL